jgi:hypothetical protein
MRVSRFEFRDRNAATHLGGRLKIERVLAELRKEKKKIDQAIAALEPLVREYREQKRTPIGRQRQQRLQAKQAKSAGILGQARKSARIIQFPSKRRRVSCDAPQSRTGRILRLDR